MKSAEPFEERHFMKRFAERTLRTAGCIPMQLAANWTGRCNGEENVYVSS